MADLLNMDFSGLANQASSAGYTIVMTIIGLTIFLGIIFMIWYILQFKHRVRVKVLTKNGFYIIDDKAREIKDKESKMIKSWKLWKLREVTSVPPDQSIFMTKKGKFTADAYWTEDTGIVWVTDTVTREKFNELVKKKVVYDKNNERIEEKVIRDSTQPFTTQERSLQAWRITQAMNRKHKSIWDTIAQIAVPLALVMLFVMVLIFWEDIAKPVQQLSAENVKISAENAKISEQNARILSLISNNQIDVKQTIGVGTNG